MCVREREKLYEDQKKLFIVSLFFQKHQFGTTQKSEIIKRRDLSSHSIHCFSLIITFVDTPTPGVLRHQQRQAIGDCPCGPVGVEQKRETHTHTHTTFVRCFASLSVVCFVCSHFPKPIMNSLIKQLSSSWNQHTIPVWVTLFPIIGKGSAFSLLLCSLQCLMEIAHSLFIKHLTAFYFCFVSSSRRNCLGRLCQRTHSLRSQRDCVCPPPELNIWISCL